MAHIVVDGGGTNLRVARYHGLDCEATVVVPIDPRSYSNSLASLTSVINELRGGGRVDGIGVSIAGNTDGEQIIAAGNLGAFRGHPFASDLRAAFRCPVWLFGDGRAMAASEYTVRGHPLVLAIWGSGVNFTFAMGDDILLPSSDGPSIIGEGGHQLIVPDGWACGCGQCGCLEAYVGGSNIKLHYGKPAENLAEHEWNKVIGHMAHGLHNVITLTGGKLPIYFGGGIACKQEHRLSHLEAELQETKLIVPTLPAVRRVTYGEDAGLHGASQIVMRSLAAA